jgi:hypothetical protein
MDGAYLQKSQPYNWTFLWLEQLRPLCLRNAWFSFFTEEMRQPPYLCYVDQAKILKLVPDDSEVAPGREMKRYKKIIEYCEDKEGVHSFVAQGAFLKRLLKIK